MDRCQGVRKWEISCEHQFIVDCQGKIKEEISKKPGHRGGPCSSISLCRYCRCRSRRKSQDAADSLHSNECVPSRESDWRLKISFWRCQRLNLYLNHANIIPSIILSLLTLPSFAVGQDVQKRNGDRRPMRVLPLHKIWRLYSV